MKSMIHRLILLGLFLPLLAIGQGAPVDGVSADLEGRINDVLEVFYGMPAEATRADREKAAHDAIGRAFNFPGMVRRAFGRHWRTLTADEQLRLTDLIIAQLVRAYTENFANASRPTFVYRPAVSLAEGRVEVSSTATLDDKPYGVVYRLLQVDGRWEVYDVIIEGVSLISNYREQIDAHFRGKTAADLIAQLEAKLGS